MVSGRHSLQSMSWKRFKNRKQTIRDRWQRGQITDRQRLELLAQARAEYEERAGRPVAPISPLDSEAVRMVDQYLAGTAADERACRNELCIGARSNGCQCDCDGAGHGAAWGRPPLFLRGRRRDPRACVTCGVEFVPTTANHRFCRPACRTWEQRRAAPCG